MTTDKQGSQPVAALSDGTVIDHIPPRSLFKCVHILGLEDQDHRLSIGNNLDSRRMTMKGIIKVSDVFYPEATLNRIALVAPTAVVNTIRGGQVVEKHPVALPRVLRGIVKCDNPKCVSNNEPMTTVFEQVYERPGVLRCHYCNHTVACDKANIL